MTNILLNLINSLMFDVIYDDIIFYLFQFLEDKDKINFCDTSKRLYLFKKYLIFNNVHDYYDILNSSYGKFTKIKYYAHTKNIPNGVTHLIFRDRFNEPLENCIPKSVTHITFGKTFNQSLEGCLPDNVYYLKLGSHFNRSIKANILKNITHLEFGFFFNKPILESLPPNLTHLKFGRHFNKSIKDCIPESVTYLKFGCNYNQSIDKCIPNNVKHLKFGTFFNQPIGYEIISHRKPEYISFLPNNLSSLKFGYSFKQSINKLIPQNIKRLKFNYYLSEYILGLEFNDSIYDYIPKNVQYLIIDGIAQNKIRSVQNIDIIFPNLKQLNCGAIKIIFDRTKNSPTKDNFGQQFHGLLNFTNLNQVKNKSTQITSPEFTRSELTYYSISSKLNNNEIILESDSDIVDPIPKNIQMLYIIEYSGSICQILPSNIKCLYIYKFCGKIERKLPSTLRYLIICNNFNQCIGGLLPDKIKYLILGSNFYQSLEDCLPKSLKYLGISRECYDLNKKYIDENIYVEFIGIGYNNLNESDLFNFRMIM
ncbi:fnip repeat-containing protein [Moumouvirus maliensis]|nr:fnip repeat-containing protein [Moumouvirus maliensis]